MRALFSYLKKIGKFMQEIGGKLSTFLKKLLKIRLIYLKIYRVSCIITLNNGEIYVSEAEMREIYLDNSATTRVYPEAAQEAYFAMTEAYGNPSSLHLKGVEAEKIREAARKTVADALGGDVGGLYFTSGGTEANNLAVIGGAMAKKRRGDKIVVSVYEHDSVMKSAAYLEKNGFTVLWLYPDENGVITPEAMASAVDEKTVLVSVMLINNEIGSINPIAKLVKAAKAKNPDVLFHCDAVQAFCKMPFSAERLGVDLMTVTAHKIGGPKGVGALWIRKGVRVLPIHFGGEQEKELRPGTEALPLIAAFGKAVSLSKRAEPAFEQKMRELNVCLLDEIENEHGIVLNSPKDAFPGIVNLSVLGIRSEIMLHYLENRGIYVSSGSA